MREHYKTGLEISCKTRPILLNCRGVFLSKASHDISPQKNIQELDRQISLLETECEQQMEADKRESTLLNNANSKIIVRESPNKAYITGPSSSASTYSSRMRMQSPTSKGYPINYAHFRTLSEKFSSVNDGNQCSDSQSDNFNSCMLSEKRENSFGEETPLDFLPSGICGNEKQKVKFPNREHKKPCKRSMSLIKEVTESSEENGHFHGRMCTRKKYQQDQIWCELLSDQNSSDKWDEKFKCIKTEVLMPRGFPEQKFSSDEDNFGSRRFDEVESKSLNGKWQTERDKSITPRRKNANCRRPRSARTKKTYPEEIHSDMNPTKTLQEKEIQCMLENDEREKTFLINLNESIKDLIQLLGELKTKSCKTAEAREKSNDILNDMQNTFMKISKIKSVNTVHNPLNILASLDVTPLKLPEGEENILDLKKTLLGIKKFCQDLTEEKSALTEELNVKSRALASSKSKEKEYLSLISSLKFNLEKMKEEADDGTHAKRDLKVLKTKLQEETKVIEALKKSHEKMQELIENYVLENDKLKAQVKITKLESHKFNVLLAGKEVEINKYKKEIQSFQRQITEQLSLLRSKATENEIERALEAISNQTNILQTEVLSNTSDVTLDKEISENFAFPSTETTSESFSNRAQPVNQSKNLTPSVVPLADEPKRVQETKTTSPTQEQKTERNANISSCGTCRSIEEEPEPETERQLGLQRVLSSSKNLRSSINELLEDIRRESSENHWSNLSNSGNSSSQTTLIIVTSDDASEGSQND